MYLGQFVFDMNNLVSKSKSEFFPQKSKENFITVKIDLYVVNKCFTFLGDGDTQYNSANINANQVKICR